ncbi:ABC transporter permease [Desulfopila sp. IMCC35008]|uniref:ABC transporter permease n=1 Tax=Desulfopila sp. IMCC35008 TaxID=2653858 RepID=UPI0013CF5DB8|nr:ABC transporter permease [Desulfopila sp. IMCC35008]
MTIPELLRHELHAVFTNPAVLLTVFGGVFFYSILYPLPYASQVPRDQRVVVVNLDGSQLSRSLERMVDATPQVLIAEHAYTLEDARQLFIKKDMAGILVIPEHFHRDLLLGRSPTLSYAGDASYFLVYGTVLEGMAQAGGTLAAQAKVTRMVMSGQSQALAAEQHSAIHLNIRSVFNPTSGYVNYVIPAIFVLILHHTLIMGAGILGGTQKEMQAAGNGGYWLEAPPLKLIVVRASLLVAIYWLLTMFYFGVSFQFYDIPRRANLAELNLAIFPFLLSSALLGICLGQILPRREHTILVVLTSSMPLIFGSGFVWPVEAIPAPVTAIISYIPVVPGIKLFLGLNQLGGTFKALIPLWQQLWICAIIYGLFGWGLLHHRRRSG